MAVVCALAVSSVSPNLATASGAGVSTDDRSRLRAQDELANLQLDKAIQIFSRDAIRTARTDWKRKGTIETLAAEFASIGRVFAMDENMIAATQCYLIANRLAPDNKTYTAYLADGLMRTGRTADAEPLFKTVQQNASTDLVCARTYIRYVVRQEDYGLAERELQKAMKLPGAQQDWRMHHLLGRVIARRGYTNKAIESYKKAAALCPDKYSSELILASAAGLDRKPEIQEKHLNAAGAIHASDGLWRTDLASCIGPDHPGLYREQFVASVQSPRFVPKAVFGFGNYSLSHNVTNTENAVSELEKCAPWHEQTYQLRGKLLRKNKMFKEAADNYERLIAMHPYLGLAYVLGAEFYLEQKDDGKAIKTLQLCTQRLPGFANGWRRLGDAYFADGRSDDAKSCYEKALALLPSDRKNLNELANNELSGDYAGLGCYYYAKGEMQKAFEYADKANETKFVPKLPWYLKLIQIRPGRIDWNSVSKKEHQEAAKHAILADMLRPKRLQDCIKEYRLAAELNPDEVAYHTYLLDALSESGDWMGAAGEDWQASHKMVSKIPEQFGKMFDKNGEKTQRVNE